MGTDEVAEALRDLDLPAGEALTSCNPRGPESAGVGAEPRLPASALPPPLALVQTAQSFRPAWIAAGLALLAACHVPPGGRLKRSHI